MGNKPQVALILCCLITILGLLKQTQPVLKFRWAVPGVRLSYNHYPPCNMHHDLAHVIRSLAARNACSLLFFARRLASSIIINLVAVHWLVNGLAAKCKLQRTKRCCAGANCLMSGESTRRMKQLDAIIDDPTSQDRCKFCKMIEVRFLYLINHIFT